ncbi:MAG: sugar phosphate isomerase/epimerase [Clostridia bacterium]|nr:sugar phosphate isomerase/epimerase [Clostridia bacterium]
MSNELDISVISSWLHYYGGEANPTEAFEVAKAVGIEALDFSFGTRYYWKDVIKRERSAFFSQDIETIIKAYTPVKEAMEKTGIRLCQAHAPFPLCFIRGEVEEFNLYLIDVVEKCLAVCKYLSIPALVVHPSGYFVKEIERKTNLTMYRRMIPLGKKYGVKLCLENLFYRPSEIQPGVAPPNTIVGGACSEAAEAAWYIDTLNAEAGEDIFGFCFDLGHANLCKRNIREELNILGHRLTLLHLHENDSVDDQHALPMTQRKTDWDGLIEGLRDINYRGAISFETAPSLPDPKELVPVKLKYIAKVGQYIRDKILEER